MQGEPPTKASTPTGAVFLSYASQDAEAAERICEALRAAGVEVWFDQSELRGGDAWDQSIRRQIKNCALFIPVVSRHTHERAEGYFRLEWKLAVDRSHLIMANKAFLLPVVIDDTREDDENVPDKFREVHWTRLLGGETPPPFAERVKRLLTSETSPAPYLTHSGGNAVASHAATGSRLSGRRAGVLYGAIAAALLLTLGYLGVERLNRSKPTGPAPASIAVLPLANESGEASQQYFSDGLSEDLITALSQFPGLKVIGRTSAFQFRDSKEDSRSIGAKLGVARLLEGSVRKSGEMIRVSAELIDTADGSMQWSEHYDRPYKDLFALQDEITQAVVGALRTRLQPRKFAAQQSDRPPSGNLEAYNAYLQGEYFWARGSEDNARKVIEYYAQATALDPRYALAWSRLSRAWTRLGQDYLDGSHAQEAYAHARAAADRALALAPNLAAAHLARSWQLGAADFDWRGAEAEARRALELAPNDGLAKSELAIAIGILGDPEQALGLQQQALQVDPLRPPVYLWLANFLVPLNRLDEAEGAIRKAIELQPGGDYYYSSLAIIRVLRGDTRAALLAAQKEPAVPSRDYALALALQIGADRSAADGALKTLIEKHGDVAAFEIAKVYALRRDPAATFMWLDRAWENRDTGIEFLLLDPFILRYKDDPRFAAFCRKVGLPVPGETPARNST
jgi:TolB-like protein/Flp pilus assembly protein TadD